MKPFCRKCLLSETDENELMKSIQEYIALIPKEKRSDASEYERRLSICRDCESITRGMCGVCGCYVELRAAKKEMYCADVNKRW